MSNEKQKIQYSVNGYLKELIELLRQEFPETAKDEQKLIDTVGRMFSPVHSDLIKKNK